MNNRPKKVLKAFLCSCGESFSKRVHPIALKTKCINCDEIANINREDNPGPEWKRSKEKKPHCPKCGYEMIEHLDSLAFMSRYSCPVCRYTC